MALSIRSARLYGVRRLNASTAMGEGDVDAPTISSTSPTDDATGVAVDAVIEITFNENIYFHPASTITLRHKPSASFTLRETFNTTTLAGFAGGSIAIVGNVLTVTPGLNMTGGVEFALRIAADAIKDASGNFFAGITNDTTLSWTIVDGAALDVTKGAQSIDYGTTFDYYVRPGVGDNGNAGTSYEAAWATIQHAVDTLQTETGDITVGIEGMSREAVDFGTSYDASATYDSLKFYCYGTSSERAAGITAQEAITGWTQCTSGDTILTGLADKTVCYKKQFTPPTDSALYAGQTMGFNLMEAGVQQVQANNLAATPAYAPFLRDRANTWPSSDSITSTFSDPYYYMDTLTDTDLIGMSQTSMENAGTFMLIHAYPNVGATTAITSFNSTTGEITLDGTIRAPGGNDGDDPVDYVIVNAPHLITGAGQYAVTVDGSNLFTVYYVPNTPANLENGNVTYGARQICLDFSDASNFEMHGLTFMGSGFINSIRQANIMNGPSTFGSDFKFKNIWTTDTTGHSNGSGGMGIGGTDYVVEYLSTNRHIQGAGFALALTTRGKVGYVEIDDVEQGPFQSIAPGSSVGMIYHVNLSASVGGDTHSNKANFYGTNGNPGWDGMLVWGVNWPYGVRGYFTWQRSVGIVLGCALLSSDVDDGRAIDNQSSVEEPVSGTKNLIIFTTAGPHTGQTDGNLDLAETNSSGADDEITCSIIAGVSVSNAANFVNGGGNIFTGTLDPEDETDIFSTNAAIWSDIETQALIEAGPAAVRVGIDKSSERTSLISRFNGATDDSGNIVIDYDRLGNPINWSNPHRGSDIFTAEAYTPATVTVGTPGVVSDTQATVTVSTTTAAATSKGGGIYIISQPSSVTPTPNAAQIKAGNMGNDASAPFADSKAIAGGTSPYSFNATTLTAVAQKFYAVEIAPDGTAGTVVASSEFTPASSENGDWQQFDGASALVWSPPTGLPAADDVTQFTVCYTYKPEGSDASSNIQLLTLRGLGTTSSPFSNIWGSLLNNWNRVYDSGGNLLTNPISQTMTIDTKYAFFWSFDKTTDTISYAIYNLDTGSALVGPTTASTTNTANDLYGNSMLGIWVGASNVLSNDCYGEFERVHVFLEGYLEWTTSTVQHVIGSDFQTLQDKSVLEAQMGVSPIISMRGFDLQDLDNSDGTGGNPTFGGAGSITTAT